jgi:hypothetical protein
MRRLVLGAALALTACSLDRVTFRPDQPDDSCPAGTSACNGDCFAGCGIGELRDPQTCSCACPAGSQLCRGRCSATCASQAALVDDFTGDLDPAKWGTAVTGGPGVVSVDRGTGTLQLATAPSTACATASAYSRVTVAITAVRAVSFETVLEAHHGQDLLGNPQPRGLRSVANPHHVLEFVSGAVPSSVTCRSAESGVTETTVDIGGDIAAKTRYRIEATQAVALFFVNDTLVCSHTANIPTGVALNAYYATSDDCSGDAPVWVDRVEIDTN